LTNTISTFFNLIKIYNDKSRIKSFGSKFFFFFFDTNESSFPCWEEIQPTPNQCGQAENRTVTQPTPDKDREPQDHSTRLTPQPPHRTSKPFLGPESFHLGLPITILTPHLLKLVVILQFGHILVKPPIINKSQPNLLSELTVRPIDVIENGIIAFHPKHPHQRAPNGHPYLLNFVKSPRDAVREDALFPIDGGTTDHTCH
jgi:hypothetical protein